MPVVHTIDDSSSNESDGLEDDDSTADNDINSAHESDGMGNAKALLGLGDGVPSNTGHPAPGDVGSMVADTASAPDESDMDADTEFYSDDEPGDGTTPLSAPIVLASATPQTTPPVAATAVTTHSAFHQDTEAVDSSEPALDDRLLNSATPFGSVSPSAYHLRQRRGTPPTPSGRAAQGTTRQFQRATSAASDGFDATITGLAQSRRVLDFSLLGAAANTAPLVHIACQAGKTKVMGAANVHTEAATAATIPCVATHPTPAAVARSDTAATAGAATSGSWKHALTSLGADQKVYYWHTKSKDVRWPDQMASAGLIAGRDYASVSLPRVQAQAQAQAKPEPEPEPQPEPKASATSAATATALPTTAIDVARTTSTSLELPPPLPLPLQRNLVPWTRTKIASSGTMRPLTRRKVRFGETVRVHELGPRAIEEGHGAYLGSYTGSVPCYTCPLARANRTQARAHTYPPHPTHVHGCAPALQSTATMCAVDLAHLKRSPPKPALKRHRADVSLDINPSTPTPRMQRSSYAQDTAYKRAARHVSEAEVEAVEAEAATAAGIVPGSALPASPDQSSNGNCGALGAADSSSAALCTAAARIHGRGNDNHIRSTAGRCLPRAPHGHSSVSAPEKVSETSLSPKERRSISHIMVRFCNARLGKDRDFQNQCLEQLSKLDVQVYNRTQGPRSGCMRALDAWIRTSTGEKGFVLFDAHSNVYRSKSDWLARRDGRNGTQKASGSTSRGQGQGQGQGQGHSAIRPAVARSADSASPRMADTLSNSSIAPANFSTPATKKRLRNEDGGGGSMGTTLLHAPEAKRLRVREKPTEWWPGRHVADRAPASTYEPDEPPRQWDEPY